MDGVENKTGYEWHYSVSNEQKEPNSGCDDEDLMFAFSSDEYGGRRDVSPEKGNNF